jgi:hypothetical protein
VPSENITIRPSWLSFSTFSMCVSSLILRRIRDCQAAYCLLLHTLGYVSSIGIPTDESPLVAEGLCSSLESGKMKQCLTATRLRSASLHVFSPSKFLPPFNGSLLHKPFQLLDGIQDHLADSGDRLAARLSAAPATSKREDADPEPHPGAILGTGE